jgi:hypothetical protein
MPHCKRCQAQIRWQGRPGAWTAINHVEGTPHQCAAPKTCRYCEKPVVWRDRQCFELDGTTLHNDVCAHRDECSHCGQKVRWTLVEGKWLAMDTVMTRELHWGLCPKNADAAKAIVVRLAALETDNKTLRDEVARLQREANYHQVELRRLTQKAEGKTKERA